MTERPEEDPLEDLFDQALEVPAQERGAWLDERCAGDARLRGEVESLLESHDRAQGFLGRSAIEEDPELASSVDPMIGVTLGHYRIIERIGEGGMGSVYVAERDDDRFDRRVAIKLIRRGMNTQEILSRFDRERRVLANLSHSNIAGLLDAGALPDGSPYFVMEYIEGERLDEYCDRRKLSVSKRIELFRTVCDAVAHAHQNLIVHRDLKPANILVTEDGEVKLLDFGVAKMLGTDDGARAENTVTVERRLTPAYASPEQIRGEPVTTASDVYSLGVILYELLTGSRPYRLDTDSWRDLEQAICDAQPTRPSVVVHSPRTTDATVSTVEISRLRGVEPSRLRRLLKGDIEWVVLMALRKEPARRYATVQQFSDDLRRISESRPVLARPDTLGYRVSRFVRRNRAGVAWAGVLLVGLVVASVISVNFAISESRARDAEERQRRIAVKERDRAIEAEQQAEQRATELEQVAAFQADQFARLDIEQMGQRVREAMIEAAELDARLLGVEENEIGALQSRVEEELAGVNFANVARDALNDSIFGPGLDTIEAEFAEQPLVQARLLVSIATAMGEIGLLEPSIPVHERAMELFQEHAGPDAEQTLDAMSRLANACNRLGRDDEAFRLYSEALHAYERSLGRDSQRAISMRNALGAVAQAQSDIQNSERYYTEALELAREHLGDSHDTTLIILNNTAFLMLDMGRLRDAEVYFEESLRTTQKLYGSEHERTVRRIHAMGILRQRQGRFEEAEPMIRRAFEYYRANFGDQHPDTTSAMLELSRCLYSLRRLDEAENYAQTALDLGRRMRERHHQTYRALSMLGRIAMARGDKQQAAAYLREEVSIRTQQFGRDHPSPHTAR
ncbi:MAG: tetratricopeptide repeat protein, partial [Phycisphaerales bacterium JB050]